MKTYTKEQLIMAMIKYDKDFIDNPQNYTSLAKDEIEDAAVDQVERLLSFVE